MTTVLFTGNPTALKAFIDALVITTLHEVVVTHEKGTYLIIYS